MSEQSFILILQYKHEKFEFAAFIPRTVNKNVMPRPPPPPQKNSNMYFFFILKMLTFFFFSSNALISWKMCAKNYFIKTNVSLASTIVTVVWPCRGISSLPLFKTTRLKTRKFNNLDIFCTISCNPNWTIRWYRINRWHIEEGSFLIFVLRFS